MGCDAERDREKERERERTLTGLHVYRLGYGYLLIPYHNTVFESLLN